MDEGSSISTRMCKNIFHSNLTRIFSFFCLNFRMGEFDTVFRQAAATICTLTTKAPALPVLSYILFAPSALPTRQSSDGGGMCTDNGKVGGIVSEARYHPSCRE